MLHDELLYEMSYSLMYKNVGYLTKFVESYKVTFFFKSDDDDEWISYNKLNHQEEEDKFSWIS